MPANLTPQYEKAEARFRSAATSEEKLDALEEMIRLLPKHKGTEKIQADLKRRLSKLKSGEARTKTSKQLSIWNVPRAGGGQVALFGCPNAGKSALLGALTNAKAAVADFPFTTHAPTPGIMMMEDAPIQLVDLPSVTADHVDGGLWGLIHHADAVVMVVDLSAADVLDQVETLVNLLASRRLQPVFDPSPSPPGDSSAAGPIRALMAANKTDAASPGDLEGLEELYGERLRIFGVSAVTGKGLDRLRREIFELLAVMRVYAKEPGKEADRSKPFVLPIGSTIAHFAETIHRDFPSRLKFARIWGAERFNGIQVHGDYVLADHDVVELHIK
jgi:hypothetical protein